MFVIMKPWKQYSTAKTIEKAQQICDYSNMNNSIGAYVVEMEDEAYHEFLSTKRFNLDKSPVVYDPKMCAPTQAEKEMHDKAPFISPFQAHVNATGK